MTQGYIGVTSNLEGAIYHQRETGLLQTGERAMFIKYAGDAKQCYLGAAYFRKDKNVGLNKSPGGGSFYRWSPSLNTVVKKDDKKKNKSNLSTAKKKIVLPTDPEKRRKRIAAIEIAIKKRQYIKLLNWLQLPATQYPYNEQNRYKILQLVAKKIVLTGEQPNL